MSELQEQISKVEQEISDLEEAKKEYDTLRRLEENPDFKKIILEGYFLEDAARMLLLKDDPALSEEQRKHLQADMCGPGALKRYFFKITQVGLSFEDSIMEAKETLEELHLELTRPNDYDEIPEGEHE